MAVAYSQELLDRATAYVARPLNSRRYEDGLTEISQLYAEITGQPVGKCQQCQYSDFLAVVNAYIRQATTFLHPETVSDTTYTLAPAFAGETLVHPDYAKSVTAENLTDEDAEFFIKQGRSDLFVKKDGSAIEAAKASTPEAPKSDARDVAKELETEQKAHKGTTSKLEKETAAHTKTSEALKTEKEAHKNTKKELADALKEVTELQKQLAKATQPAETATTPEGSEATGATE